MFDEANDPDDNSHDHRPIVNPVFRTSVDARRSLRRLRFRYKTIAIRQTARRIFDLTGFGKEPAERIASAVAVAAVFFVAGVAAAHLYPMERQYRLLIGIVGFLSIMVSSAVLILWDSDEELESDRERIAGAMLAISERADTLAYEERAERERQEEEDNREPEYQHCPYCDERIRYHALKCRYCGEILDERLRRQRVDESRPYIEETRNPGLAAVLSFLIAGLGQIYKGSVFAGILWFLVVAVGYASCCLPGFILHFICILDAASGGTRHR